MPAGVRKSKRGGYDIVDKDTGEVDATKAKAQRSANARNASRHDWKPTRR